MIDINKVIKELKKVNPHGFIIESHFQVEFGYALKHVYPDYEVTFEWYKEKKKIDLVASNGEETVGFEFKYFTKKQELVLNHGLQVQLKQQNNRDLHRIGFWKDVSKLETFINNKDIDYGYCLFLSNDEKVFDDTNNNDKDYSIADGIRPNKKDLRYYSKGILNPSHNIDLLKNSYNLKKEKYNDAFNLLPLKID